MSEITPSVSIIIPCRNEERLINKCLDSILVQDYPKNKIEVLVVDGMSTDRTRQILADYKNRYAFIKLLDNPKTIAPTAMNIGIKNSMGRIVIRMDAHAQYPWDYVSKCIRYTDKYNSDNIGGVWVTLPGAKTMVAKTIVLVLSSSFGVGNALFRIGVKEPIYVDTVPFGCYRREVFDRIGLFNENLVRNQDLEFNLRLKKAGGKILLVPDIISYYYARSSLSDLLRNNFLNGFWVIYSMKFAKLSFSVRHLVPSLFIFSLILSLVLSSLNRNFIFVLYSIFASYLVFNLWASFNIALKKGIKYLPFLIITFLVLHFSYGLGSICGALKLAQPEKRNI